MIVKGPQLAYYLKRRNPELYERAKKLKETYDITWKTAIEIATGKKPPIDEVKLNNIEGRIKKIEEKLNEYSSIMSELDKFLNSMKEFKDSWGRIEDWMRSLLRMKKILQIGLMLKFGGRECEYMDGEGYCTRLTSPERIEGLSMRNVGGRWFLNVREENMLLCAFCPQYKQKRV